VGTYYVNTMGYSRLLDASEGFISGVGEDQGVADWAVGDAIILVTQVYYGGCNKAAVATGLSLEFSKDGGEWTQVGSATEIAWAQSADTTLVNDAANTNISLTNVCTARNGGKESETDNAVTTGALGSGEWYDIHWGLNTANAVEGSVYTFRIYDTTNSIALGGSIAASITMEAGAVSQTVNLNYVSLALSVPTQNVTPGAVTVVGSPVSLTFSIPTVDVSMMSYVYPNPVNLTLSVPSLTVVAGQVNIDVAPISLTVTAPSGGVLPGQVTVDVNNVSLTFSVPSVGVGVINSVYPNPVSLALSIPSLTVVPGNRTVTIGVTTVGLSLPVSGIVVPGIQVTLNTILLNLGVPVSDVIPGEVIVTPNTISAGLSIPVVTVTAFSPSALTVYLNTIGFNLSVLGSGIIPGSVEIINEPIQLALNSVSGGIIPGVVNIPINPTQLSLSMAALAILPGAVGVDINHIAIVTEISPFTVVVVKGIVFIFDSRVFTPGIFKE
jgi:hypothetical protein